MKKLFITFCIFFVYFLMAQEIVGYKDKAQGEIKFTVSAEQYYSKFSESNRSLFNSKTKDGIIMLDNHSAILKFNGIKEDFYSQKQNLKQSRALPSEKIEPVLIYADGTRQIVDGQINMKLKSGVDVNEVIKKWKLNVSINEFDKEIFLLTSSTYSTEEIFSIVNELQGDDKVIFAEPNFIKLIKPTTSDPYFSSQWSIKNNGQNGTPGADMKVEQAWQYATGNGVKVAVIDEGVDLNHPDLKNNLLGGYDATGRGSNGGPEGNDAHGTACAGIVAGVANNNRGVAGVSYNAKIIPIRLAYGANDEWVFYDSWAANAINWAWRNGADVLSNSWGGGSYSNTIVSAINNAVTNGRSGKGSVVLFAAGNDDNGTVSFPGSLANVIAVGASSMCDQRKNPNSCDGENWWGSNYGTALDVVAPGVKIYATDISGYAGYNSGDYTSSFNGTSSACPNTAGVVALILSANKNLTQKQARDILESTTDKARQDLYSYQNRSGRNNGTWNNQMGYGRVNALKALQKVNSLSGRTETNLESSTEVVESFKVYPNPVKNTLYVEKVDGNTDRAIRNGKIEVGIYDAMGNLKASKSLDENSKLIDVSGLQKGVYILKLESNGKSESKQIIKD